jgi:hypothetical protein
VDGGKLQLLLRPVNFIFSLQPLWPELSVEKMWAKAIQFGDFRQYMPDNYEGNHKTNRPFFFGVFTSLHGDYVNALIADARAQRMAMKTSKVKDPPKMIISAKWADRLLAHPWCPSKFAWPC